MNLSKRKIEATRHYRKHPYPKQIEAEDLLGVLTRVRDSDKNAIDEMILGHSRLALSIVNRYVVTFNLRRFQDDLDSAAIEGVVVAVNKIAKGGMKEHNNCTGYIVKYIHQHISNCIYHCPTVSIPQWRKTVKFPETLPVNLSNEGGINKHELIESIAENDSERQILELRSQSYTDIEVAERTGVSVSSVRRIRHKLFKRYQERSTK